MGEPVTSVDFHFDVMCLACGRIDPQAQIDAGLVRWTGGAELGSRAARKLRHTM